jgi:hypothetical protein
MKIGNKCIFIFKNCFHSFFTKNISDGIVKMAVSRIFLCYPLPLSFRHTTGGLVLRRYTHKTSGFKTSSFKTSEFKKHPCIFCPCSWWKSAGSVAAMFAGKAMAVFYLQF